MLAAIPMLAHSILVVHNFWMRGYYHPVMPLLTMSFSHNRLDLRLCYGTVTFSSPLQPMITNFYR